MEAQLEHPAEEIKRLQRCIDDLVGVVALSAAWGGGEPAEIVRALSEALLDLLGLDLVYVRLEVAAGEVPIETILFAQPESMTVGAQEVGELFDRWWSGDTQKWPALERHIVRDGDMTVVPLQLGLRGEFGVIVAGSRRADFPQQTESLVLSVAANQAVIGLQQALLLNEQRRIAGEHDGRAAHRKGELDAANEALKKEVAERERAEAPLRDSERELRLIMESIPGLLAVFTPDGEAEFVNRRMLEYFGRTFEEMRRWENGGVAHPEDHPRAVRLFADAIASGTPFAQEVRVRRSDGIYRWVESRVAPLRDKNGQVVRWYNLLIDIDERKHAEEALTASERNLKLTIDTIPAMAWSARPDGTAEFFNQHYLDFVGLSAEQAGGWGWTAALHPDDLGSLSATWQRSLATESPGEAEARLRRHDGAYRWFLFRTHPLRDESGRVVKWYGTNTDIDDRKRAEAQRDRTIEELQAQQELLDLAQKSARAMAFDWYVQQEVNIWSPEQEALYGLPPGSFDGTYQSWKKLIYPPDWPLLLKAIKHAHETGVVASEFRVAWPDGTLHWLATNGRMFFDEQGKPFRMVGFTSDVTPRKLAEQDLRRSEAFLAEAQHLSSTGSFSWHVATDVITWSEHLYRIYELEIGVPVTLGLIRQRVHPDDLTLYEKMVEQARNGGNDFEWQYRLLMPDHSIKYLHAVAHATHDQDGELEYIAAIQDVTERRLSEETLGNLRSELAHVSRVATLGALTASIAHEVNQPLSGIITNASTCLRMLAADPPNVEGARETARRMIRDGHRASDVITQLRALFGKKAAATETFDLNEATREVIALSLRELRKSRVIPRLELADDLPPVAGDRVQLQQVILNLLLNALDAMSGVEDCPTPLVIRTARDEDDHVRLSVQDAGVGFDPQAADRLFQAFYTTKGDGMGIGLSVSRSIIESHQGRLWATLNDGPGATFSFSIPHASEAVPSGGEVPATASTDAERVVGDS
ncbi:MAG TPA: PAS domain-containing protein [Pyrinomonadaceae bacterium]